MSRSTRKAATLGEAIAKLVADSLRDGIVPGAIPAIARKVGPDYGRDASTLLGVVGPAYYAALGRANPLPASAARGPKALANAIRKRRDAGGPLGRWDVLRSSVAATIGRTPSEAAVRTLYEDSGGSLESSYLGRGTRISAPATYVSAAAEVVAALPKERKERSAKRRASAVAAPVEEEAATAS